MRPLPLSFENDGFTLTQILRSETFALYSQVKPGSTCYEVIRIRRASEGVIMGNPVPAREKYPRPDRWGYDAWSIQDRQQAEAEFRRLAGAEPIYGPGEHPLYQQAEAVGA